MYDSYDAFAFYYNRYWTENIPKLMKEALKPLLFDKLSTSATILDLCCGTGNNAQMMKDEGYDVIGVDGSRAMLAYAKINAPDVEFQQADARDFKFARKFDAVTSLFDSMNHMLTTDELLMVFKNVHDHLYDDGIFVFDMNSLESSQDVAEVTFTSVTDDYVFISQPEYDKKTEITKYNLTALQKDEVKENSWQRHDIKIYEKYYAPKDVVTLLHMAGFQTVQICDGLEDLEIESFEGRTFFICWAK